MGEAIAQMVTLVNGPCDGMRVTVTLGRSLLMEDEREPGRVARYRPGRKRGTYTFRGYDQVVARLPEPGSDHA